MKKITSDLFGIQNECTSLLIVVIEAREFLNCVGSIPVIGCLCTAIQG